LYSSDLTTQLAVSGAFDPREGLAGLGDGNIATVGGGFIHILDGSSLATVNFANYGTTFSGLTGVGADKVAFSFQDSPGVDQIQLYSSDLTTQIAVSAPFDEIVDMIGLSNGNIAVANNQGQAFILDGSDLSIISSVSGFGAGSIVGLAEVVPEPASLLLMGVGGLMILCRPKVKHQ